MFHYFPNLTFKTAQYNVSRSVEINDKRFHQLCTFEPKFTNVFCFLIFFDLPIILGKLFPKRLVTLYLVFLSAWPNLTGFRKTGMISFVCFALTLSKQNEIAPNTYDPVWPAHKKKSFNVKQIPFMSSADRMTKREYELYIGNSVCLF